MLFFRLQCVKFFCREVLLWVWDILWSVKSWFPFKTFWDNLWIPLLTFVCSYPCTQIHYSWRPAKTSVGFTFPSPSGGCKMLSVLSSSGEKWRFVVLPKPGVLCHKMSIPFLPCRTIRTQAKQQDGPTPWLQRLVLLRWKSAMCSVNSSLGSLLD